MADKRVQLALVIHNHQPVGNFDHVIADACQQAYLPFLRMLLDFPRIRIGLHTSGCLLEWMEQGCPEYFELVRELLSRGQLELLGGGMYEPILAILPERDARRQLLDMRDYLLEHFNQEPKGIWLAERVWEPHLPKVLADADVRYTLLDDFHFRGCAMPDQVSSRYFDTQHDGGRVALLPISEQLRYTMPFQPPEATLNHLRSLADNHPGLPLHVFGDDGEKFGVWPETYEWVYVKGWLRDFLTALTEALDWVELSLPSEALKSRRPAGNVYIPCASYKEMGEWTRVDPEASADDPPGHWRNYLAKYSEAQDLYARMLQVSQELEFCGRTGSETSPSLSRWRGEALRHLGRAQCNCAYWHGVFGGLYLNNLRHALNSELLLAERRALELYPEAQTAACLDWDDDNGNVLSSIPGRLRTAKCSLQLDAAHGLTLSRLDAYEPPFVWTNVLTRRKEHYHHKLSEKHAAEEVASIHDRVVLKEEGLEDRLIYDLHPRTSFNCYFAPRVALPEQFLLNSASAGHPWQRSADDYLTAAKEVRHEANMVSGIVQLGPCQLRKGATLIKDQLCLSLALLDGELRADELLWVEFNFNVLTDQANDRYLVIDTERLNLSEARQCPNVTGFMLCDGWQQRQLRLECPAVEQLVVYPIYTVSSSEGGFERTYQGSCFMLGFALAALDKDLELAIHIEELVHAG